MNWQLILAYAAGIAAVIIAAKIFSAPVKLIVKLVINCLAGGLLIILLNFIGATFGIQLPLNFVTAFIAGILGIPGFLLILFITLIL
jgi:inhibitor of the pro-sigma K processing machinery